MSTIDGSVCKHGWTTPPECPSCMAIELDALRDSDIQLHARNEMLFSELESLRQENSRLREALKEIRDYDAPGLDGSPGGKCYEIARTALKPS